MTLLFWSALALIAYATLGFPLILFLWIARVWLVGQRGELHDDPVAFALKDRQSLVLGAIMALAFVLAWAGAPL